jgi:DNA mismatch repair ATPase MutS
MYCQAVAGLAAGLETAPLGSRGLLTLRGYLQQYVASAAFQDLSADATRLTADLEGVRYQLHLKRNAVVVSRSADETDYSAEIEQLFARFRQGEARDYRIAVETSPEVNQLEAAILVRVARLHPEVFDDLQRFVDRHQQFLDDNVTRFDREVQVYLSYFDYIRPLRDAGFPFCYPAVSRSKAVRARGIYDLALATAAVADGRVVVRNDFHLAGSERIFVVTGPNQGGKTTFARTFGQLHHLAALGLPVPGEQAELFLCDRLLTHFGREENPEDLRGKLEDDLLRMREILGRATSDSIVILNEVFNSTTLRDATAIGRRVLTEIAARDLLCVFVTFIDELATPDGSTVSLVSAVDAADPAIRTYRVVRAPADGRAYAAAIAAKYRLTYEDLRARLDR